MPLTTDQSELAPGILEVDLAAIAANYHTICERAPGVNVAAAIKADAYGLGAGMVIPALANAGCTDFFVATVEEGVAARQQLGDAKIYVLGGVFKGQAPAFAAFDLIPVLNGFEQARHWREFAASNSNAGPAMLHVDTGMNRLGMPISDVAKVMAFQELQIAGIMSHLACASTPDHTQNQSQLTSFQTVTRMMPDVAASLANSAGVFLGPDFHFDMVRVGISLFGGTPQPGSDIPLRPVVTLKARILQERDVKAGQSVGYEAGWEAPTDRRIATLSAGYADGFPTTLSNKGHVLIGGQPAPIVGRVSMDLMTVDVTNIGNHLTMPGHWAELIGPDLPIDMIARRADMIS